MRHYYESEWTGTGERAIGYKDIHSGMEFKPVLTVKVGKYQSERIAKAINEAIDEHLRLNEMPEAKYGLLGPDVFDPNDPLEGEERRSRMALWLANTERLEELSKGPWMDKVRELKHVMIECLKHYNFKVTQDEAGNYRVTRPPDEHGKK